MKRYYLESLGCAKNLVDSEAFAHILAQAGYRAQDDPEGADLVLVNTCGFLESALAEAAAILHDLCGMKRGGKVKRIVVTGCAVKRALELFREGFPDVDHWVELKDFAAFASILNAGTPVHPGRAGVEQGFHRYLRISDGCVNHCSYCTIPSIRGSLESVPIEDLVAEARSLATSGKPRPQELIVIAQDTCNYGMDIYGRQALPELLTALHAIEEYAWIRVMYMHPDHFDPAWLSLWDSLPRLLPYFEIPIQHSQPGILKAMRRQTADAELKHLLSTIRQRLPQAVLRTTLISGFPGETRADHIALQRFIRDVQFTYMGVFTYSREEGTPAYSMPDQVPARTARARQNRLLSIQEEISTQAMERYAGRSMPVLVERLADGENDVDAIGRAWCQAPDIDGLFYLRGKGLKPGSIVMAEVDDTVSTDLFGTVVPHSKTHKGFA